MTTQKTYLITGAGQGLGRSLTLQLAQNPGQLILLYKDLGALNRVYDEITQASDLPAEPNLYPIDLLGANIDHYREFTQTLTTTFGQLDGVFLNAASHPAFTPILHFDMAQWYEVLHTNLNANFHLIQQTLPLLSQGQTPFLVAISDAGIDEHPAYYGAYGVAKAGLEQLMKTTAAEMPNSGIHFYTAKLMPFQSKTRSILFSSEDPTELPSSDQQAKEILRLVLEGLSSEQIIKLN